MEGKPKTAHILLVDFTWQEGRVKCEGLPEVSIKNTVVWDVTPCILV
jgi:hypothetical protein